MTPEQIEEIKSIAYNQCCKDFPDVQDSIFELIKEVQQLAGVLNEVHELVYDSSYFELRNDVNPESILEVLRKVIPGPFDDQARLRGRINGERRRKMEYFEEERAITAPPAHPAPASE